MHYSNKTLNGKYKISFYYFFVKLSSYIYFTLNYVFNQKIGLKKGMLFHKIIN